MKVKFITDTKWFRKVKYATQGYLKKGVAFVGGDRLPFIRGTIMAPKAIEGKTDHIHPVYEDGKD